MTVQYVAVLLTGFCYMYMYISLIRQKVVDTREYWRSTDMSDSEALTFD